MGLFVKIPRKENTAKESPTMLKESVRKCSFRPLGVQNCSMWMRRLSHECYIMIPVMSLPVECCGRGVKDMFCRQGAWSEITGALIPYDRDIPVRLSHRLG